MQWTSSSQRQTFSRIASANWTIQSKLFYFIYPNCWLLFKMWFNDLQRVVFTHDQWPTNANRKGLCLFRGLAETAPFQVGISVISKLIHILTVWPFHLSIGNATKERGFWNQHLRSSTTSYHSIWFLFNIIFILFTFKFPFQFKC